MIPKMKLGGQVENDEDSEPDDEENEMPRNVKTSSSPPDKWWKEKEATVDEREQWVEFIRIYASSPTNWDVDAVDFADNKMREMRERFGHLQ